MRDALTKTSSVSRGLLPVAGRKKRGMTKGKSLKSVCFVLACTGEQNDTSDNNIYLLSDISHPWPVLAFASATTSRTCLKCVRHTVNASELITYTGFLILGPCPALAIGSTHF